MKSVKSFAVQGTEVTVPVDEEEEFAAKAAERNVEPEEIRSFRVSDADGNVVGDVTVPQSEMEAFSAKARERGASFEPMRTLAFDDGTERTMPVEDISRYLRSSEYRDTEDYKKSKAAFDEYMGSPTWAGVKGMVGGAFQGAWQGANATANKIVKALPEVGIGVESMAGNVARFAGKGLKALGAESVGGEVERAGEAIVADAAGAKAWLDHWLPSDVKDWTGYEDWSTKASDWVGNAAAMAVKFAPGGAQVGGKAFLEACFASDGANAFANTYDTAIANGADPAVAAALGAESALINYFGGKALMKAGGIAEYVNGAAKKFVASGLGTSAVMASQGAGNKAVENLAKNKPVMEGVAKEAGKGAVEGFMFHVYNALPGVARAAAESRAESRRHDEFIRGLIVEHAKTDHGAAQLAAYFDGPALDAAITARKSGGKLTRRMADEIGLPKTMPLDEAESVVDAVTAQRRAMAERARLRMDDVQAQALAETLVSYTGEDAKLFEAAWLKAVEKISDAKEMDDPAKREEIVAKAVEEVAGTDGTGGESSRAESRIPRAEGESQSDALAGVSRGEGAGVRRAESGKAMLLLQQIDEGTLPVEELEVGLIEGRAPTENGNVIEEYDAAKAKPIVVLEDLEGNYHALTGGKRLSMATASGAEKIKAVVVREADGWTADMADGLGATENLREGSGTLRNVVEAVDTLGVEAVQKIAGWHQTYGSRDFASTIRRGLNFAAKSSPELKAALAEGRIGESFAASAADALSMERIGENWLEAQKAVMDLVGKVSPEELESVLWGMQKKLAGKAATADEIAAAVREAREDYNAKSGGEEGSLDSDTTLVETGEHELKTMGEVESGMPGAGEESHAEAQSRGEEADAAELKQKSGVFNSALNVLKGIAQKAGSLKENFYKAANKQFGANHSFDFGKPVGMLKGHLPDKPIHLKLKTLLRKRSEGYKNKHPFDFDEVADIVEQVHNPALLLKNEEGLEGVRAFFQVGSGRVFMVAIKPDGEINDISTLFPKDFDKLVMTVKMLKGRSGDVLGLDAEKAIRMLESRSNTASALDPNDLLDAVSVLKNLKGVNAEPVGDPETEPLYAAAEAAKGNKAVELKPVTGKDGTFTTLAFPDAKIKIDGEHKVIAIDGLTADDFAGMKATNAAALVAKVEAKAAELGLDIGFYDDGVRAVWEGVKEKIKAEGAAAYERKQLAEKSGAVIDMLQKSFPDAKLHKTAEEWAAAKKKYGYELKDAEGEVYGFTDPETGDIFLNPEYFGTRQALETPIHEYGHLGIIATKTVNKAVYDRGMTLAGYLLSLGIG